jgi:periplasmic divalent cation tolerance protein
MTENNIWVLYSTFASSEEALFAANILLEKRLIACANVLDQAVSVYRWQGGIQREKEAIMIAKTSREKVSDAIQALSENHPYQLPGITAYPIEAGFAPYLQWVADETAG